MKRALFKPIYRVDARRVGVEFPGRYSHTFTYMFRQPTLLKSDILSDRALNKRLVMKLRGFDEYLTAFESFKTYIIWKYVGLSVLLIPFTSGVFFHPGSLFYTLLGCTVGFIVIFGLLDIEEFRIHKKNVECYTFPKRRKG